MPSTSTADDLLARLRELGARHPDLPLADALALVTPSADEDRVAGGTPDASSAPVMSSTMVPTTPDFVARSLRRRLNAVYTERAQLVAALARLAPRLGWRVGFTPEAQAAACADCPHPGFSHGLEGCAADECHCTGFRAPGTLKGTDAFWCIYFDTPAGQLSWHLASEDLALFTGIPAYEAVWDRHTTSEKYARLASASTSGDPMPTERTLSGLEAWQSIEDLLMPVPLPQRAGVLALFAAERDRYQTAPGSRRAHQAWPGGYWDHVHEVLNLAVVLYAALGACRPLPFALGDALLVLFLHDAEKPVVYQPHSHERPPATKAERRAFREALCDRYGIGLTPAQHNALTYVEGEGDDYRPGERVMGPLAAFCHLADVVSARIWHDQPQADRDRATAPSSAARSA